MLLQVLYSLYVWTHGLNWGKKVTSTLKMKNDMFFIKQNEEETKISLIDFDENGPRTK